MKNTNFSLSLSYDDVLLVPQFSTIASRNDVSLDTQITSKIKLKIPLISANMSDITGVEMAIAMAKLGGLGVIPRFKPIELQAEDIASVKKQNLLVAGAVGARNGILERAEAILKAGADLLVLDVAHGHMQKTFDAVAKIKNKFSNVELVAGNVATYEACDFLFRAGADSVKVGIGPGSICTTRVETGSGVPQLTAVIEASKAARSHKKYIIADGGIKNSGDVVKSLAAGASAIMAGSIFAGTDEAPGKIVKKNGKKYKIYNASTSISEKRKHFLFNRSEIQNHYVKQIEGVESLVPYKASVKKIIEKYAANIRSGFSYLGANNINALWKKAKFIRVTPLGLRENGSHDVLLYN